MFRVSVFICSFLCATVIKVVNGFPTGAGDCPGGIAAVGGSHLGLTDDRPVSNSTLETGGVTVQIGDIILVPNTPLDIATFEDHTINIVSAEFPLRGILIRVEANGVVNDTSAMLTPGVATQEAMACVAPIVGTTHIDASDKSEITSTLRLDESLDGVTLDITGVFVNGVDGSVYIYSRYIVNFVSVAPTMSMIPTTIPTNVPITTITPTISPVTSDPPSVAPIVTTTEPTVAPVAVETESPTATPVAVETESPVAEETESPTAAPFLTSDEPSGSPVKTTASPVPTSAETSEPSLRGGKGKGMGMGMDSKDKDSSSPSTAPKGMGKGMMMNGSSGGKMEKKDMKKSKDEVEIMDEKHSMAKLSKKPIKSS